MVITQLAMRQFCIDNGMSSLIVDDELIYAYRGLVIHWRSLNGQWFIAWFDLSLNQFDIQIEA